MAAEIPDGAPDKPSVTDQSEVQRPQGRSLDTENSPGLPTVSRGKSFVSRIPGMHGENVPPHLRTEKTFHPSGLSIPDSALEKRREFVRVEDKLVQKEHRVPTAKEVTNEANLAHKGYPYTEEYVGTLLDPSLDEPAFVLVPDGGLDERIGNGIDPADDPQGEGAITDPFFTEGITGDDLYLVGEGDLPAEGASIEDQVLDALVLQKLFDKAGLTPKGQKVLFERVVMDRELHEIGDQYGQTSQNASRYVSQGVDKLRQAAGLEVTPRTYTGPTREDTRRREEHVETLKGILAEPGPKPSLAELAERIGVSTRSISYYMSTIYASQVASIGDSEVLQRSPDAQPKVRKSSVREPKPSKAGRFRDMVASGTLPDSLSEAADAAGISQRTVYNYLRDMGLTWQEALEQAKGAKMGE